MDSLTKTKPDSDPQQIQLEKIEVQLKKINRHLGSFQTTLRGFLYGIASGIGATVGLALVLFLLARLLSAYSYNPIVNRILNITKLDSIIQVQPTRTDNSAPQQ